MSTLSLNQASTHARALWQLCKPRVLLLILFCAVIGMLLASPGWPDMALILTATTGIGLVAAAAAMVNCLVERSVDARMYRTAYRATVSGETSLPETLLVALLLGAAGMIVLFLWVNALTAWLTLATFVGYAVVYTVWLKPATPQNIVIGGASGAMPPVLGWVAVTQQIDPMALALFLIIYAWTPPHFWALALYRRDDYARAGLPMLPVTHGERFTTLSILLYALLLMGLTLLPVALGNSGLFYLLCVMILNLRLVLIAVALYRKYAEELARRLFAWSIWYLAMLFAALLLDHYWLMVVS